MSRKRHRPEEIIANLREADILLSQGTKVAEAVNAIKRLFKAVGGIWSQPPKSQQVHTCGQL